MSDLACAITFFVQAVALERDTWRQQYEELRDRKLRDSGKVESQAQVWPHSAAAPAKPANTRARCTPDVQIIYHGTSLCDNTHLRGQRSNTAFDLCRPPEDVSTHVWSHSCSSCKHAVNDCGNTFGCCDRASRVTVGLAELLSRRRCRPQVISQLMERSEEATQQARELAAEAEQLQVRRRQA